MRLRRAWGPDASPDPRTPTAVPAGDRAPARCSRIRPRHQKSVTFSHRRILTINGDRWDAIPVSSRVSPSPRTCAVLPQCSRRACGWPHRICSRSQTKRFSLWNTTFVGTAILERHSSRVGTLSPPGSKSRCHRTILLPLPDREQLQRSQRSLGDRAGARQPIRRRTTGTISTQNTTQPTHVPFSKTDMCLATQPSETRKSGVRARRGTQFLRSPIPTDRTPAGSQNGRETRATWCGDEA